MPGPAVPSSEEVTTYLAAHKLEPVIEDAVNDAVLKQVKVCPGPRSKCQRQRFRPRPMHYVPHLSSGCAEPFPPHCRDPAQEE